MEGINIGWVNTKEYIKLMERYHEECILQNDIKSNLEFNNIQLFKEWSQQNNIKKWLNESSNWTYIISRIARWNPNITVPYQDHKEIFKDANNKNVLIIQPYYWNIDEIKIWAKNKGISINENTELSWHYPNHTNLIEFRVDDEDLFRKAVKTIRDLTR